MEVVSFTVNHDDMLRGVYVSRLDKVGDSTITTFDVRMKVPNIEPVLGNAEIHTMEHLMAVYLRSNKEWADNIIYIGPMGCRTGMYLIVKGDIKPLDVLPLLQNTFSFIINFDSDIPATTSRECGNYLEHNLAFAKWEAKKYYEEVLTKMKEENMVYPK